MLAPKNQLAPGRWARSRTMAACVGERKGFLSSLLKFKLSSQEREGVSIGPGEKNLWDQGSWVQIQE